MRINASLPALINWLRKKRQGLRLFIHKMFYWIETFVFQASLKSSSIQLPSRNLVAMAVGGYGESYVRKLLNKLPQDYDALFFVWDDKAALTDPVFKRAKIVREKGTKFPFAKKYITSDIARKYGHIFVWDDDIDTENFSFENFLKIFSRNRLELAQPALTRESVHSWEVTLKQPHGVGRFTDFVEIMIPVFTSPAWLKFSELIDLNKNPWGWGCDLLARSLCHYKRMGIIDAESVWHMKELSPPQTADGENFLKAHPGVKRSMAISYARMH